MNALAAKFRNLSLAVKLSCAIVIFVFPIALMGYFLVSEKDGLIEFTRQEIAGVEYLRAAQVSLAALTDPNPSKSILQEAAAKLGAAEKANAGGLNATDKTRSLIAALADPANATDALAKTTDLISALSDKSNITLDPDGDAYFIGDILVNQATGVLTQASALIGASHDLDIDKSVDHQIAFAEARDGLAASGGNVATDLSKAIANNADGSIKANLEADGNAIKATVERIGTLAKTDDHKALESTVLELMTQVRAFTVKNDDEMDHLLNVRIEGFHGVIYQDLAIAFVSVLLGGLVAWLVVRSVAGPLTLITGLMGRITGGDLNIEIPRDDRTDEIGGLIVALKAFYDAAVERDKARTIEQQRISEDRARSQHIEQLNGAFNTSVGGALNQLNEAVVKLDDMAHAMAGDSKTASHQATTVAAAAEQAAVNVQTVASAAEELSASIKEISGRVSTASTVVNRAAQEAKDARSMVVSLSEATAKIGDVVNLINQIAGQTNLLALNATIEAARAGEAGKGFAVVASEVKTLANQTAKATEDITGHIDAIQAAVRNVTTAMEHIDGVITQISEVTVTISSAIEEQGAATLEISRNVQEASIGTTQVTDNITQIARVIATGEMTSQSVLSSAQSVSGETKKLEKDIGEYLANVQKV